MGPHVSPYLRVTQAAEGLPRRCWSTAEIEAMVEAGIIDPDERFELIGGEVVPMSPKGARHEWIKAHLEIIPETTLRLDPHNFVEPDFCVFHRDLDLKALNGPAVLLAVEIADSSLAYDTGRKIGIYARFGVREVWVVDAIRAVTIVHRQIGTAGYADVARHDADARLVPTLAPELAVRLSDLGIVSGRDGA